MSADKTVQPAINRIRSLFGMSAPMKVEAEHFGFTADHVAATAKELLARCQGKGL
jgi:hypothetical protein